MSRAAALVGCGSVELAASACGSGWAGVGAVGAGPPHLVCMRLCLRRNILILYLIRLFLVLSAPPPSCFLEAVPVLEVRRRGLVPPVLPSPPSLVSPLLPLLLLRRGFFSFFR